MSPWISPEFRARQLGQSAPRQITGSVEHPIDAQARDVTPAKRRDNRAHYAFCAVLAIPVLTATAAAFAGDLRLCAIACLVGMAIALIGLYALDGPA
jgi:hypothetical protein